MPRSPAKQLPVTPVRPSPKKPSAAVDLTGKPVSTAAATTFSPMQPESEASTDLVSPRRPDCDPSVGELEFFTPEEVDHMRSLKDRLDRVIDNEDNISVR